MDLTKIESQILKGLPDFQQDLKRRQANVDFYRGHFDKYREKNPYNRYSDERSNRSSLLVKLIVNTLTMNLYKRSPVRTIPDNDEATNWLAHVYKDNTMFAKFQSSDRASMLCEVAAWQVAGTDLSDPLVPVKIHLWTAANFVVFPSDDDPIKPGAVCTIDMVDDKKRYNLWTKSEHRIYMEVQEDYTHRDGGTVIKLVLQEPNPYMMIPFSYVHYLFPSTKFWNGGLGDTLKEVNAYINDALTRLGDAVKYLGRPMGYMKGVREGFEFPKGSLPGDFVNIPTNKSLVSGADAEKPDVGFLEPSQDFVTSTWNDIASYVNHTLECAGVPEAAIRMVQSVARSGMSIQSEQLGLLNYSKSRQDSFTYYEAALAKLVVQVACTWLAYNRQPVPPFLVKALENFELRVRWPDTYMEIPGPERDRAEQFLLEQGLTSRLKIMMNRWNLTREEALDELRQVVEDRELEDSISPPPALEPPLVEEPQDEELTPHDPLADKKV